MEEYPKLEVAWMETLLRKVSKDRSVSKVLKVIKEDIGVKGDNYASRITQVTLELIPNSGRKSKMTLIVKSPLDLSLPLPMFKLEIKIYADILTEFNALMNEFQDSSDPVWCEMIGYEPYNIIVLEDLKAKNFKIANRREFMDMNHALLVLNSLAKLHGISYVLLQREIINQNDLGSDLLSNDNPFAKRLVEGGFKQLACVMEEYWPPEWLEAAKKFDRESEVGMEKVRNIMDYPKDTFLVMNHGDCWTCNMMFKYSPYEESRPIAVKFIDFQFSNINSYILDVIHFIYMCIRPEIRRQNFNRLLEEYQKSLESNLKFYGMPERAPTIEQVHAEAKRAEYLGMFFSTCFLPPSTAEISDSFSFETILGSGEAKNAYNPEVFKPEKFRKSIAPDIKRWMNEGLL